MSQTKKQSLIETLTNIVIGLITSFIIQIYIYDYFDIEVTMSQNVYITLLFFCASIIRGYSIRRFFNSFHNKEYSKIGKVEILNEYTVKKYNINLDDRN